MPQSHSPGIYSWSLPFARLTGNQKMKKPIDVVYAHQDPRAQRRWEKSENRSTGQNKDVDPTDRSFSTTLVLID